MTKEPETLKHIFDILESRNADWEWKAGGTAISVGIDCVINDYDERFSVADLLANASWCRAVWPEPLVTWPYHWTDASVHAFQLLQHDLQNTLNFIYQTMQK